jgi:hypothetical protein
MEYFEMVDIIISPIEKAMTDAIEKVIGAVAAGAASATEVAQTTGGAQGTAGGTAVDAGQSSQTTQTGAAHKNDVSAPEVIESFNVHALKDLGIANKALVAQYIAETASNSKLYDITATALGLATLGATHNMTLQQQMASDHRDQNHDRQINVNETDAYSVLAIASAYERLRNPTPAA